MLIDIRSPISFETVNRLLLKVAQSPLNYTDFPTSGPPGQDVGWAAKLAREASASVVCNCTSQIWSETVAYLHALEPQFPLYPNRVSEFVKESRLPWLSYISLYYSLCKVPFVGSASYQKLKVILDLRHELEHDKPETHTEEWGKERTDRAVKWMQKLRGLVGEEDLLWLPRVRRVGENIPLGMGGEPVIMKFMKCPVAKWVFESTLQVTAEMERMMFEFSGQKKLASGGDWPFDERHHAGTGNNELRRLWAAGE